MTTTMNDGRHVDTDRRRERVTAAITAAARDQTPLTASAIARTAGVDRAFSARTAVTIPTRRLICTTPLV
ncbi:hypothetical protein ABZ752_32830 [Streptomyces roseifaciens]